LGSTGSYAYLTREQRKRVALLARELAGDIPMMVCVGAVSTDAILRLTEDAQQAGADACFCPQSATSRSGMTTCSASLKR
jgi:4-hydroxy-tetrahydrodipicolinate synthase